MLEEFYTFPANRVEALTILYLEKQDLSDCSPEQLADLYLEVHTRISREFVARAAQTKKTAAGDKSGEPPQKVEKKKRFGLF